MNTDTIQPTARTALLARAESRPATTAESVGGHRLADYIVDVFFVVVLAAPFVIFKSPATVEDAVVPAYVAVQQDAGPAYGPE